MRNGFGLSVCFLLSLLTKQSSSSFANFPTFKLCGDDEDVKPSNKHLSDPECWSRSEIYQNKFRDCEYCGEGYDKDYYGRCTICASGYSRNQHYDCVHCPSNDEKWCRMLNKCICLKNAQRNDDDRCVPCGENEESDGYTDCECKDGFGRNEYGICAQCGEHEVLDYQTKRCVCRHDYVRNGNSGCFTCADSEVLRYNQILLKHECVCDKPFVRNKQGICQSNWLVNFSAPVIWFGFFTSAVLGFVCGHILRQYRNKSSIE